MDVQLHDALVVIGDLELVRRKQTARIEQLEALLADPVALRAHIEQLEAANLDEPEALDAIRTTTAAYKET